MAKWKLSSEVIMTKQKLRSVERLLDYRVKARITNAVTAEVGDAADQEVWSRVQLHVEDSISEMPILRHITTQLITKKAARGH